MLDDLTKTFFDTFGIEPNTTGYELKQVKENARGLIRVPVSEYPQISDRILLELFDILRTAYNIDFWSIDGTFVMDLRDKQASYTNIFYRTGGDLKTSILNSLNLVVKQNFIDKDTIKHQVQAIFEGE